MNPQESEYIPSRPGVEPATPHAAMYEVRKALHAEGHMEYRIDGIMDAFISRGWRPAPVDPAPVPQVSTIEAAAMLAKVLGVNPARITHVDAKSVTVSEAAPVPLPEDGELVERLVKATREYALADYQDQCGLMGRQFNDAIRPLKDRLSSLRESVASLTRERDAAELEVQRQKALHDQSFENILKLCEERDALRKALEEIRAIFSVWARHDGAAATTEMCDIDDIAETALSPISPKEADRG